jgi:hypothetical protein
MSVREIIRRPSGFAPLVLSAAALGTVLLHLARYGPAPQPDEGAAAHLFQLLIGAQAPIVLAFAFRWLPREPRPAVVVLLIQFAAVIVAFAPVFLLGW